MPCCVKDTQKSPQWKKNLGKWNFVFFQCLSDRSCSLRWLKTGHVVCFRFGLKSLAKLFNFVVFNPCQSSPSLTILVPLCFVVISLVFFYFCEVLFSGFLQFNSNFVDAQNNSKYRDWAPLSLPTEGCDKMDPPKDKAVTSPLSIDHPSLVSPTLQ